MLLNFSSIESKNMNANYFAKLLQMMINNFLVRREIGKNLLEKKRGCLKIEMAFFYLSCLG